MLDSCSSDNADTKECLEEDREGVVRVSSKLDADWNGRSRRRDCGVEYGLTRKLPVRLKTPGRPPIEGCANRTSYLDTLNFIRSEMDVSRCK